MTTVEGVLALALVVVAVEVGMVKVGVGVIVVEDGMETDGSGLAKTARGLGGSEDEEIGIVVVAVDAREDMLKDNDSSVVFTTALVVVVVRSEKLREEVVLRRPLKLKAGVENEVVVALLEEENI